MQQNTIIIKHKGKYHLKHKQISDLKVNNKVIDMTLYDRHDRDGSTSHARIVMIPGAAHKELAFYHN